MYGAVDTPISSTSNWSGLNQRPDSHAIAAAFFSKQKANSSAKLSLEFVLERADQTLFDLSCNGDEELIGYLLDYASRHRRISTIDIATIVGLIPTLDILDSVFTHTEAGTLRVALLKELFESQRRKPMATMPLSRHLNDLQRFIWIAARKGAS